MRYELNIFWRLEDQAFLSELPELPFCIADGACSEEALANSQEVIAEWIKPPKPHPSHPRAKGKLAFGPPTTMKNAKPSNIEVRETAVGIPSQPDGDGISLTDKARNFDGASALIEQWIKNKDTVRTLGTWKIITAPEQLFLHSHPAVHLPGAVHCTLYQLPGNDPRRPLRPKRRAIAQCQLRNRREHPRSRPVGSTRRPHQRLPQSGRLAFPNNIAITSKRTLLTASSVTRFK